MKVSRQRRENPARGELQESAVGDFVHAAAPGVVDLPLQTMPQTLHRRELKPVVVAVRTGRELRHRRKSRIGWLHVWEWREASWAYRLVAVYLRQIGLVDGASANVLRLDTGCRSELMLNAQAPLHEVRRVKLCHWAPP